MPTNELRSVRLWCGLCAAVLIVQILSLGSLPFELREPFDKVFHVLAFAALALMLWIATDGRRPVLLLGGLLALGLADEARQAFIPERSAQFLDFVADAAGAAATCAILYWKQGARKPCAESSARSRAGTSSRS
jgi:VanZ family protein